MASPLRESTFQVIIKMGVDAWNLIERDHSSKKQTFYDELVSIIQMVKSPVSQSLKLSFLTDRICLLNVMVSTSTTHSACILEKISQIYKSSILYITANQEIQTEESLKLDRLLKEVNQSLLSLQMNPELMESIWAMIASLKTNTTNESRMRAFDHRMKGIQKMLKSFPASDVFVMEKLSMMQQMAISYTQADEELPQSELSSSSQSSSSSLCISQGESRSSRVSTSHYTSHEMSLSFFDEEFNSQLTPMATNSSMQTTSSRERIDSGLEHSSSGFSMNLDSFTQELPQQALIKNPMLEILDTELTFEALERIQKERKQNLQETPKKKVVKKDRAPPTARNSSSKDRRSLLNRSKKGIFQPKNIQ